MFYGVGWMILQVINTTENSTNWILLFVQNLVIVAIKDPAFFFSPFSLTWALRLWYGINDLSSNPGRG